MAEMKRITYTETPERLMAGMHRETSFAKAGQVWQEFYGGGANEKLSTLPSDVRCCDDIDDADGIGLMYDLKGRDDFNIIIGDFVKLGTEMPEGFVSKHIPGGLTAQVQIEGNSIAGILSSAYLLIIEAIEKTGKQIDYDHFYWCEIYTVKRYSEPLRRGEKICIDYMMPVEAEE